MNDKFVLNGKEPVPCADLMEWARWFETAERHVRKDKLSNGILVSTVFLGLDHSFGEGPPLLFETMIFGADQGDDEYQERYSTWIEAMAGHLKALRFAKKLKPAAG